MKRALAFIRRHTPTLSADVHPAEPFILGISMCVLLAVATGVLA